MRILVVDDDIISRRVLQVTLAKWGYDVVTSSNGLEAWQILRQDDAPNMAILDWVMPGMDGVELCREIRKMQYVPYIYTLLLTGKISKQDLIEGMHAGADDYIRKPFDPEELKVRLRAGKRILDLQAELLAARESMRYQATHDSLTGLLNRGAILDVLRNEVEIANRRKIALSVVVADIDLFKRINDAYGHVAGDAVLHEAARRMKDCIRSEDAIGRYGGEEFLAVLPGCPLNEAVNITQRLRKSACGQPAALPGLSIEFSISFGVSSTSGVEDETAGFLVQAADRALYQAKERGRNCVVAAEGPQNADTRRG